MITFRRYWRAAAHPGQVHIFSAMENYNAYLTKLGKSVITLGLKTKELFIILRLAKSSDI